MTANKKYQTPPAQTNMKNHQIHCTDKTKRVETINEQSQMLSSTTKEKTKQINLNCPYTGNSNSKHNIEPTSSMTRLSC